MKTEPSIGFTTFSLVSLLWLFLFSARLIAAETYSPTLHLRLGPDSNACGITAPVGAVRLIKGSKSSNKKSQKLGLIIWLHGGMRSTNREKGFEAHRALIPFLKSEVYYLASPSAFGGEDWLTPKGQEHLENLITHMLSLYPIDSSNINLVGVSDGTLGLIAYSAQGKRHLNRRVLLSCYPQIVLPIESLPGRANFATGTWDFFQGGHDRLFPADQTIPYLKEWERVYPNAHLHFFPDGEHDFSFYASHASNLLQDIFNPVTKKAPKTVKSAQSGVLQNSK